MKSNRYVLLRPVIVGQTDTVALDPVMIAGRRAWFYEIRKPEENPTLLRAGAKKPFAYSRTVEYAPWMEQSQVVILCDTLSECNCEQKLSAVETPWPVAEMNFTPRKYQAAFSYVPPRDSAEKIFNLSGKANIIFKVNRTDIDWQYKSNYAELDSIVHTIEAVKDNPDATVEAIKLTGYASPEGSYANNVRLAKGRTEAVKEYVQARASFPASVYHTDYVPEDWAGLRSWLETSIIPGKEAMIAFIDDPSIPAETRNDIFRARFPEEYPFLLQNVYPQLRHTDYLITYRVRKYADLKEIKQVFETHPKNLSLNELFLLANEYPKGSPEYDEVFETAVRLYPDNEVANLNAANSAMNRGDFESARRYLSRVSEGPEGDYARGMLCAIEGEYGQAREWLEKARQGGMKKAEEALKAIDRLEENRGDVKIL